MKLIQKYFLLQKKIQLCLLLVLCTCTMQGQVIDSLEQMLRKAPKESNAEADILNELAREYVYVNPMQSIHYAENALFISTKNEYEKGKAYAYRGLASAYSSFGSFYLTIDNVQNALIIFDKMGDSVGIANCYISLGHTYRRLKNRNKELLYNKAAYDIFEKLQFPDRLGVTSHNLGETYLLTGDLTNSILLTTKAIKILDSFHNLSVLSSCYKVMGKIFIAKQDIDSAESYFNKVLAISKELGDKSQKVATIESMIELANIYDLRKKNELELTTLIAAADYVAKNKLAEYVQEVYTHLIKEYIKRNQNQEALKKIAEFNATTDSISKRKLSDRDQLTTGFIQTYELEKKNNKLVHDSLVEKDRAKIRSLITAILAIIIIMIAGFLIVLVKKTKRLKRSNEILTEKENIISVQNKKLEELNENKDKFFSVVSHDIKSPLNALLSFSTLLLENFDTMKREQLLKLAAELKGLLGTTIKMTDNLITWAKVQMKDFSVNPEKTDVKEIVNEVFQLYFEVAKSKNITLSANFPEKYYAFVDKNHIQLIIRNLVNNAIKYSTTDGLVKIIGTYTAQKVVIYISDTGTGISPDLKDKLFTNHPIQSRKGTAGEDGTGLGLKLCFEFAQLNQGNLKLESSDSQGSVFALTLPAFSA